VLQAQDGNSEAFGQLYDAYMERIYRFVYFRVEDQQTAEDITSRAIWTVSTLAARPILPGSTRLLTMR
jgi:DNA-directed RNA polymerase specialized sigma24 family protein